LLRDRLWSGISIMPHRACHDALARADRRVRLLWNPRPNRAQSVTVWAVLRDDRAGVGRALDERCP
jgi:DNA-binding transcriptional LysR family regulator